MKKPDAWDDADYSGVVFEDVNKPAETSKITILRREQDGIPSQVTVSERADVRSAAQRELDYEETRARIFRGEHPSDFSKPRTDKKSKSKHRQAKQPPARQVPDEQRESKKLSPAPSSVDPTPTVIKDLLSQSSRSKTKQNHDFKKDPDFKRDAIAIASKPSAVRVSDATDVDSSKSRTGDVHESSGLRNVPSGDATRKQSAQVPAGKQTYDDEFPALGRTS